MWSSVICLNDELVNKTATRLNVAAVRQINPQNTWTAIRRERNVIFFENNTNSKPQMKPIHANIIAKIPENYKDH